MADSDASTPVVQVEGLVKRIGRVRAVDGLDLVVRRGQVMGLAGPNGSGKSVTLKVLLGLVRPTAGQVRLFGEPVRPGAPVLARVGALIDGPGFVPHLSGLDNLRLAQRLARRSRAAARAELAEVVEVAGLGRAIRRAYSTYSHGMRYRLGLAQALLGRPDLLLLDEPTTGLDPAHILEVREVIAAAARRGATVLLSSHLLSEVEHVCTHAAVMQEGRLVTSGPVGELVGPAGTVHLAVDDPMGAARVLRAVPGVRGISVEDGAVRAAGDDLRPLALFGALATAGVRVLAFREGRSLEDAYLALVKGRRLAPPDPPADEGGSRGSPDVCGRPPEP
ncbi:MAG TPA: ABC transporter ATP-binding protein [Candidatus Dormibacteraeota bacterium]